MIDRANTIQKRLEFGLEGGLTGIESLRSTSNIPTTIRTTKPLLSSQEKPIRTQDVNIKIQLEATRIKQVSI